ncbi:hypothetical protein NOG11_13050 [Parvularcula sp. BGMRC 0090]|uniref:Calcium-binding protein n=2 Tax=Parvularcula maris TaxID=2965077 RepID=A0A9X2LAU4_9PROT|nr:hypothetical protein [Parvularcula maris]
MAASSTNFIVTSTSTSAGGGDSTFIRATDLNVVSLTSDISQVIGTASSDIFYIPLTELNFATVTGFQAASGQTQGDQLLIAADNLSLDQVRLTFGSAILTIDADGDGFDEDDPVVTLEGDFSNTRFEIEDDGFGALRVTAVDLAPSGNDGNDILTGDALAEQLVGGLGNDTLSGEGGDDELFGGAGNDYLLGGAGDDLLSGGKGLYDVLDGGEGADTYLFGDELSNGLRETTRILWGEGDVIDLGGQQVVSSFAFGGSVYLYAGPDFDLIQVMGAQAMDDITFV